MSTYPWPGVYIEEITGPGVIAGVSTSVTAFIGPAARGAMLVPTRLTSFDEFIATFGADLGDGRFWPHLPATPRRFVLGHALQGFFENGGREAVIIRIGSGRPARWTGRDGANPAQPVFVIEAAAEGTAGNALTPTLSADSLTDALPAGARPIIATASAATTKWAGQDVTMAAALNPNNPAFVVGDIVTLRRAAGDEVTATVVGIRAAGQTSVLTLDRDVGTAAGGGPLRIADIAPGQKVFRLTKPSAAIGPGTILEIRGTAANVANGYSAVDRIDSAGFVYLRRGPETAAGQALNAAISLAVPAPAAGGHPAEAPPSVRSVEFEIAVTKTGSAVVLESQGGLSLDPIHPGYVFRAPFQQVRILPPQIAPPTSGLAASIVATITAAAADAGVDDNPAGVTLDDYNAALAVLADVDDISLVCVPDAADDTSAALIQQVVRDHCVNLKNRVAVLDAPVTENLTGANSVLQRRGQLEARGGFATLYYPRVIIAEPVRPGDSRPSTPRLIQVPPSGHIAGVMARTDAELGVHYAPANTDVRGVFGLDRIPSNRQQGLVNLDGVNVLRIFPGEGSVTVWGARTTAPLVETDWTYVNVRRLLIYIERSIERGIGWAVFKPNDRPLWQSLRRVIGDFLESVWRDGGLAGRTRDEAFRVRIDEALNPPAERALGRLHIEVQVAPVRPAEFIIVRIGLWDGGAQVTES